MDNTNTQMVKPPKETFTKSSIVAIVFFVIILFMLVPHVIGLYGASIQGIYFIFLSPLILPGLFCARHTGLAISKFFYDKWHKGLLAPTLVLGAMQFICIALCVWFEIAIAGYPIKIGFDSYRELGIINVVALYLLFSTLLFLPAYYASSRYGSQRSKANNPEGLNKTMKNELIFPEKATIEERQIKWQKITEIVDSDFGFNTPKAKSGKIRFDVRLLLMCKNDSQICVIKSEKYGYMQLPGGGIEAGENIIDALRRETQEETGFLIKDISPIGYTIEKREDVRNRHDWDQSLSFVFSALPEREVGTNYTDDEIAEGFKPIWVELEDFITEQENNEGKIENYSGCFSNRRDLEIAKYFRSLIG